MLKSRFVEALHCSNHSGRPPVWIMRQAGRYMPEYRAIRAKHSFLTMCHEPELAAKVTMLPIDAFGMDAAILFSDILVVAEALDVGLRFEDKVGPIIERPLRSAVDIHSLPSVDVKEKLGYVAQAITHVKPLLDVPLIGFAGAPFTVASYMIEGGSSKDLRMTKKLMLNDPIAFHALLDKIATCTIAYLKMQIDAGVNAVQLFDSWANFLSMPHFKEFSLAYMDRIAKALAPHKIPLILYCKGSSVFAEELATAKPAAISLDWNADIAKIRNIIPSTIALQGNLDPDLLYAPSATLKNEALKMLKAMENQPGYIFNLGHGILPDVSPDAVRLLVDTVKGFGR